ncbi:PqqD family protein [Pontixanthobacter aestiaquae]|uniref:PqqD family peptide modification chaperone n=1 Tax=Pontixanthobacter aestiaquae TaxID=1509367 RepID=A0A844ZAR7_9SPHN|nr:PqqD family protein [Pontixanthobacter aestiaquae]MDN3644824.1 PqqD family protein [Pontixanthobacter aestiaquae]MXO84173.1 PqqD family peptide modification chaperone [Pontixanthobacter aestiaquae]
MTQSNATLSMDSVVAHNEDVLFSEVADGMSLMDIESGKYFHFDETGARIWKQMDGAMPVSELCEKLEKQFEVDTETCRTDTLEFLQELANMDLVKTGG